MLKITNEQTQLLEELIKHTNAKKPDKENLKLSMQFAQMTLKNHQHLETDSHKINKQIDGLKEKFQIHSQHDKSNIMSILVQNFLNNPLNDKASSQFHFELISFVLEMQDCPLNIDLNELKGIKDISPCVTTDEKSQWHGQLLEDIDDYVRKDYGGGYSDDDSHFSDDEITVDANDDHPSLPFHAYKETEIAAKGCSKPYPEECFIPLQPSSTSKEEFAEKLQPEYWRDNNVVVPITHKLSNRLNADFASYLLTQGIDVQTESRTILSEYQVLREVLWMLLGAQQSTVFNCEYNPRLASKNVYTVKSAVAVHHLTDHALDEILKQFAKYGSICHGIRSMCNYIAEVSRRRGKSDLPIPSTVVMFCSQMHIFLILFHKKVEEIEKTVRDEKTHTLISVNLQLKTWFKRLSFLRDIILSATAGRFEALHWESTVIAVLDRMYDTVCTISVMSTDVWFFHWLKIVFLRICQPYLSALDALLSGQPTISPEDLFLLKVPEVKPLDSNYWLKGFKLKSFENQQILSVVPKMLHTFTCKLIITIKSMDLLKEIASHKGMPEILKSVVIEPGTFIKTLNENLLCDYKIPIKAEESGFMVEPFQSSDFSLSKFADDALYLHIFRDVFVNTHKVRNKKFEDYDFSEIFGEENLTQEIFNQPELFEIKLNTNLGILICERHTEISKCLLHTVLETLELRHIFSVLRGVFLLEACDVTVYQGVLMYDFYFDIFCAIRSDSHWRNPITLNLRLRQCLETKHGEEAKKFWITVDEAQALPAISASFSALVLRYKMSWPLNMVVNQECLLKYNQIFVTLLQLKHVKFCLERIHFKNLVTKDNDERNTSVLNRFFILRMRLLHLANSFDQYIMWRINSARIQFDKELQDLEDFHELIASHNRFITTVYQTCLLDPDTDKLHSVIFNVLNEAFNIENLWLDDSNWSQRIGAVGKIEEKIRQHINFLSGLFNEAIKRTSMEHLTPLAETFKSLYKSTVGFV